jgi:hypothetical protein
MAGFLAILHSGNTAVRPVAVGVPAGLPACDRAQEEGAVSR